ncbi:MAG: hypothetical protein ACYDDV_08705 [Methanoregula sp.]
MDPPAEPGAVPEVRLTQYHSNRGILGNFLVMGYLQKAGLSMSYEKMHALTNGVKLNLKIDVTPTIFLWGNFHHLPQFRLFFILFIAGYRFGLFLDASPDPSLSGHAEYL